MYLSLTGFLAIGYGIFMAVNMLIAPQKSVKLLEMKKRLGETKAKIIYFFSYAILPVAFGLILIYRNFQFIPKK
jgi:hypothetical protein